MKADQKPATARAESPLKAALWLALLTTASILATLATACATPFAALGALAALHLRRTEAIILTSAVWFASQVVGFGFLNYPHTLTTYAWGGALLIAAWASMAGAVTVTGRLRRAGGLLRSVCALFTAMVIFKGAIYGFGLALGGNHGAFTLPVLTRFCATNLIAFASLMVLYRLGVAIGLAARPTPFTASVAH
jgi:hypothetical protein